ncbi:MAG: flagellar basal body P-ring protein FlgI [Candidatus Kapabacteria bacterium]|nr:flagellar basal body P-ring protein FlgI [Ignavibacteriota bacterium]MCW5885779.1 flagellar basal body P-ring protein FlgI [Candidatus Kapabacteria bacterium]
MKIQLNILIYLSLTLIFLTSAESARIKDIAVIEGVSGVQVVGYGLVTGLNQTGDNQQTTYTVQSVMNMLKRFGLTVPDRNPRVRNVAAVMVTATIPSFMRAGTKVDVNVSSMGDAMSLQGGVLIMTPLSTADGTIMGMAQGPLTVGGYDFSSLGSQVSRNFTTTGRVPNGLILERNIESNFIQENILRISLRDPDFTTSARIADAVNSVSGLANSAVPVNSGIVEIKMPDNQTQTQLMQLISQIELLNVISDPVARIVINERTGTVVVGGNVQLLPSVVAQGGLEISIQRDVLFPDQAPFTIRPPPQQAEVASVNAREELRESVPLVVQGPTVQDLANALNLLKVSPRDLISIFQALKESGSLQGELIVQ